MQQNCFQKSIHSDMLFFFEISRTVMQMRRCLRDVLCFWYFGELIEDEFSSENVSCLYFNSLFSYVHYISHSKGSYSNTVFTTTLRYFACALFSSTEFLLTFSSFSPTVFYISHTEGQISLAVSWFRN